MVVDGPMDGQERRCQVLHAAMSGTSADVDGQIGIGRNSRVVRWAEQQRRHFTTCASLALAPAGGT